MTRFLFITDTHIGANPVGFHQQSAYPEKIGELLGEIERLAETGDIEFVLHGGDMIDYCCPETIREAKQMFQLSVPVYLSLGNHDLDREDALQMWLELAPEFFIDRSPQYTIRHDPCVIHVVPNQWEPGTSYYWKKTQEPFFEEPQILQLEADIRKFPDKIHLLAIHNPIFGVPREQSGLDHVIHDVPQHFRQSLIELMSKFPNVKCILSGHNHINTLAQTEEGIFVSGSSFVEAPFEYKVVEVTMDAIQITTRTRGGTLSFDPAYDGGRSFVQGRKRDRALFWRFGE